MDRIAKSKALSITKADAEKDIALINRYAVRELTADEVFCCNVVLCDNEVDRDNERFTVKTLKELAEKMLGKTGISDHNWKTENQVARIYRCETHKTGHKTALNDELVQLVASIYIPRTESTKAFIELIEAGIVKEVSIGCAVSKAECSICHTAFSWNYRTDEIVCDNKHVKGQTYDEGLCVRELDGAADGYEFSFVAVPAQRGAGVVKGEQNINGAVKLLLDTDLSEYQSMIEPLVSHCLLALEKAETKKARAELLQENQKFISERIAKNESL